MIILITFILLADGTDFDVVQKTFMNKTFLILLTGVAIGLLIAPEKGSDTLKKFINGLKGYGEDAKDKAEDLVDTGRNAFKKEKDSFANSINP